MRCKTLHIILFLFCGLSYGQNKFNRFLTPSDTLHTKRRNAVVITETAGVGMALVGLSAFWYSDFEQTKFRTTNDNAQWLQIDKAGHAFSAYQLGRYGADVLKWSGVSERDQILYGATLGFGFLTAIEVLDGFSSEWGFSWGDIAANTFGTGLYISQQLLWKSQRIALKFSFTTTDFAAQNPDQLGASFQEQLLKDYNGQTYWLSVNLKSFFKQSPLPKWFNLALGYGGEGLLSGLPSTSTQFINAPERYRQYYLSFDIDLQRIPTNSPFLKTVFNVFNAIKVPFPALEFSRNGLVFRPLR